jgi:hypothetical protein
MYDLSFSGALYALAWAMNILWARPCLSIASFIALLQQWPWSTLMMMFYFSWVLAPCRLVRANIQKIIILTAVKALNLTLGSHCSNNDHGYHCCLWYHCCFIPLVALLTSSPATWREEHLWNLVYSKEYTFPIYSAVIGVSTKLSFHPNILRTLNNWVEGQWADITVESKRYCTDSFSYYSRPII